MSSPTTLFDLPIPNTGTLAEKRPCQNATNVGRSKTRVGRCRTPVESVYRPLGRRQYTVEPRVRTDGGHAQDRARQGTSQALEEVSRTVDSLTVATTVRRIGVCGCRSYSARIGTSPGRDPPAKDSLFHADVYSEREERGQPVARHRRPGPGARARGDPCSQVAAGQTQANLHPVHRHGRSCRRRQRGDGQADRPQGRSEDLSSAQRLRRRAARGAGHGGAKAPANPSRGRSGPRHAAENQDGRRDVSETEGLRRTGSSPYRAAAQEDRGRVIWPASNTTQQDAARHPPPAFSFAPARASSPSTTAPLRISFPP